MCHLCLSGCVSLSVSERAGSHLEADQCVTSQHRRSDEEETQVRYGVFIFAMSYHLSHLSLLVCVVTCVFVISASFETCSS